MDPQAVLTQVESWSWSVEDRLRLMERIWDGLLDQGYEPDLTEAQKAEIDQRLAEDDAAPEDVVSWKKPLGPGRGQATGNYSGGRFVEDF